MNRVRIADLKLPLSGLSGREAEIRALRELAARKAGIREREVAALNIVKKSLDARDKGRPLFVYTVDLLSPSSLKGTAPPLEPSFAVAETGPREPRPLVIGAGPAGLFSALALAQAGLKPLVIEQGKPLAERRADVDRFWSQGLLDPCSNIQFGEGGAGAFSDGKLTSRSKDRRGLLVLKMLVECGADPAILYWHKPHLGSDRLPEIIAALRQRIVSLGGEFRYRTQATGLLVNRGRLQGLRCRGESGGRLELEADLAVLAIGNSARSLYRNLAEQGIAMEAKPFAVGLRIQQRQDLIDQAQYGAFAGHPLLAAADYQLTWRDDRHDRGCYTFCNCPGGYIVNASSEPDGLAVNGISLAARASGWANSAVVAQVFPGRDFGREVLAGVEYQYQLEQAAFSLGAGGTPLMSAQAFLGQSAENDPDGSLICSASTRTADLRGLFSEDIYEGLRDALLHWEQQLPGFTAGAVLAAVESRTSAPLRILRDAKGVSLNCRGLYPAGEGAGYAGGIVSSAIDGLRAAEALIEQAGEKRRG